MNPKDKQFNDIVENCSILLAKLSAFQQTDDTPEGRMISQLKWLKERAEDKTLDIPVNPRYLATLRHVYTEGYIKRHASSPDKADEEIDKIIYRLLNISLDGALLVKPEYFRFAIDLIEKLIQLLNNSARPLSAYEKNSIDELEDIKTRLADGRIEPPLMTWEDYPNFRKVYRISRSTIDDLPDGKRLCKTVANLIFEGVRPSSWTSPKAAARETGNV
jgi:hypothetical protein